MPRFIKTSLIILAMLASLALADISNGGQKKVLLVHSYHDSLPWTQQCDRGILSALPDDILLEKIHLDTKRIPPSEFQSKAEEAMARFQDYDPDLVMLGDDNALRLLGPQIAETGVPVVYFGINNNPRNYFTALPSNVVGVIERIPLFAWVRMIFDIVPNMNTILVLMDSSPTADAILELSFRDRGKILLEGKTIRYANAKDWQEWKQLVLASDYDAILMPIYHALKNDSGDHVPYETVVTWTSENTRKPVFATQDYAVGDNGVVGAFVIVGEEHGQLAGLIATDILEGRMSEDLSTADDQMGKLFFNEKQLNRFNLVLPPHLQEKANYRE